jgi:hypothetical protein
VVHGFHLRLRHDGHSIEEFDPVRGRELETKEDRKMGFRDLDLKKSRR